METNRCCKLIKMLRTFSEEEFNDFERIASSPYFSRRRNFIPYIKVLKKYFPKFEGEMFKTENTRKYVHSIVHPGNGYNDQYMKNIFSDLLQMAEETLNQKISKKYNHHNQIFLAIEETKRELFHLANHNINVVQQKLNETGFDEIYFFYKGMSEIASSILENKIHGENHETGKTVSSGESFIYFSVILIALSVYNSSARKAMLNLAEDQNFAHDFGRLIDLQGLEKLLLNSNNPDKEIILIFLYYLLHYYKQPGCNNYKKMRDMAFKNHVRFNPRMLFLICSMMSSMLYDLRKDLEPQKFGIEFHKIAEFSLKNKCYKVSETGGFPYIKFRSYYMNAIAIGECEWAEKFVTDYAGALSPDVRDEVLCLVNANIMFEKRQYDDSFMELGKVKFTQLLSKFDMRVLKMKIFFEQGLCLYAENSVDAFNKFISNNKKLAKVFLDNFTIFSKYYKALIDIAHDKVEEPMMILDEITNSSVFPERRWLLGKIEKFAKLKAHYETAQ